MEIDRDRLKAVRSTIVDDESWARLNGLRAVDARTFQTGKDEWMSVVMLELPPIWYVSAKNDREDAEQALRELLEDLAELFKGRADDAEQRWAEERDDPYPGWDAFKVTPEQWEILKRVVGEWQLSVRVRRTPPPPPPPTEKQLKGLELRRLRKEAGLTQVQVAERVGLQPTYVSNVERGVGKDDHMALLAELLGAPNDAVPIG